MSNYVIKNVDILLGNGQETFRSQKNDESGSFAALFFLVDDDFNDDSRSGMAVAYGCSDNVHILVAYNTRSFTKSNDMFD